MTSDFYTKTSAGGGKEELLLESGGLPESGRLPCDWSKDGRFLIYSQLDPKTGYDLWTLPMFGDRKPVLLLRTESNERCGSLSSDGKWIAYASDESGRNEIYVQAFSEKGTVSGRKWQVSYNGGAWPKWRRDGKELLYLAADRTIVAVAVKSGATFQPGAPQPLFSSGIDAPDTRFDVTSDGAVS
jgi:Tol biopolymer transport system component